MWERVTLEESVLLEGYRGKESKYSGEGVQRIYKRTESLFPEEIVLYNHRDQTGWTGMRNATRGKREGH